MSRNPYFFYINGDKKENYTWKQIATYFGVPIRTIRSRLQRHPELKNKYCALMNYDMDIFFDNELNKLDSIDWREITNKLGERNVESVVKYFTENFQDRKYFSIDYVNNFLSKEYSNGFWNSIISSGTVVEKDKNLRIKYSVYTDTEIPDINKIYEEYKNSGLPIKELSISQDRQRKYKLNITFDSAHATISKNDILDIINNEAKKYYITYNYQKDKIDEYLLEIDIFDAHFGKLSLTEEGLDIIENRVKNSISFVIDKLPNYLDKIGRIHLPLGNDLFNFDNSNYTTINGTRVDASTTYLNMFRSVKNTFIDVINFLLEIAPVDITIIPGNHDRDTSLILGEVIEAWFRSNDFVSVNNSELTRKYYKYGDCGFMFCHGDNINIRQAGMIFSTENPTLWGSTKYRFCKIGHFHANKKYPIYHLFSEMGCEIQVLPALTSVDKYSHDRGYLSPMQVKSFLYSKTMGEIMSITYTDNKNYNC